MIWKVYRHHHLNGDILNMVYHYHHHQYLVNGFFFFYFLSFNRKLNEIHFQVMMMMKIWPFLYFLFFHYILVFIKMNSKKIELNSFSNDDFDSAIVDVCLFVCESDPEIPRDEWKERKIFPFISYLNIKFSLPLFFWFDHDYHYFFCYYLKVFSFVILCKIFIRTRLFSFIRCLC